MTLRTQSPEHSRPAKCTPYEKTSSYYKNFASLTAATGVVLVLLILSILNVISIPKLRNAPGKGSGNGIFSPLSGEKIPLIKIKRPETPNNATYAELMQKGDQAFFKGITANALTYYQQASTLEPKESLPYEKIGDISTSQKEYKNAKQNYDLASALDTTRIELKIKALQSTLALRNITEAQTILARLPQEDPKVVYYRGLLASLLNKQEDAIKLFNHVLEISKDDTLRKNAQDLLGVYQQFDLAQEAPIEYLQTLLSKTFDDNGEYGLAIELSFTAIKKDSTYRDAWLVLGHGYLNQNKWNEAIDAFARAIELDATSKEAFFFRALAERSIGKWELALADLRKAGALGFQPKILIALNRADAYFSLNKYELAFPLYKEVVQTDPSDINQFIRPIALAINQLKKPNEAMDLARQAATTHPDAPMANNLLGWAALANNDIGAAKDLLAKALAKDPELAAAYLNLGQVYEREANKNEALKNYKKAVELAQDQGESSIEETATLRYNAVIEQDTLKLQNSIITTPLPLLGTPSIPSLSLQ